MSTESQASEFAGIPFDHLIYEKRPIASGGYGVVYKAEHKNWGIPLAIKFTHLDRPISASDKSAMLKEANKLHKAQFEYVLRLYGVSERHLENGLSSLGIVTELAENGSLDRFIQRSGVPWALRLRFVYEIALGMNYLHHLNPPLLHCDLKPANILLNKDYHVKIADFGMAEWRRITQQYSSKENKGGTLNYIAPEYLKNINTRADVKIDVYSFAIVMWEIMTERKPYEHAVGSDAVSLGVKRGQRPDIKAIPKNKPSVHHLVSLMERCWHQIPGERPSFADCIRYLKPTQPSDRDVRAAIQSLTQEDMCCVDADPCPEEPGSLTESKESISKLRKPVQETRRKSLELIPDVRRKETLQGPDVMITSLESLELAESLGKNWKSLARHLSLTEVDIEMIDYNYEQDGLVEKGYQTVQMWQQHQGKKATRAILVSCLQMIGRQDLLDIFK
ncbi:receptor-interacting serine/threonine-protein kinase 1 [Callorhinchus milii]|uniref:Receptor-interacting serine/threonine-protein kinase 2 n=1 Tax=Callorhinchus milii TaxID=7868 RepID=V9KWH2_CALMI|nr:receptor-interacting serine/threonine-protein kinase 1 [Callorhinchus milii]